MVYTEKQLIIKTKRLAKDISKAYKNYLKSRKGTRNHEIAYERLITLENRMKAYRKQARDFVDSNELLAQQKGIPKQAKLKKTKSKK